MKVSNIGNVSKNIFDANINSLKNTEVSTDFIRTKIFERKFIITNIVDRIGLLDEKIYNDIMTKKPQEWDEEFADFVYDNVENKIFQKYSW